MADIAALVPAVRAGDMMALGVLYKQTAAVVYGSAYRCVNSEQEAEDVLQDVFLGLPEALRGYVEKGKFLSWLRAVTIRMSLMRMRAQQRLREDPLDLAADVPADANARVRPIQRIAAREAIRRLPDSLRVVFMLKEVEGYSHAEIGELLGIKPAASAARLSRAWQLLLTQEEHS